jgi:hypothetical protein
MEGESVQFAHWGLPVVAVLMVLLSPIFKQWGWTHKATYNFWYTLPFGMLPLVAHFALSLNTFGSMMMAYFIIILLVGFARNMEHTAAYRRLVGSFVGMFIGVELVGWLWWGYAPVLYLPLFVACVAILRLAPGYKWLREAFPRSQFHKKP